MGVYGASGRFDATAARAAVEAHRLGLDDLQDVLGSLYEEIRAAAIEGQTQVEVSLDVVKREQLASFLELIRQDGYIVDVDAGKAVIKWGRAV